MNNQRSRILTVALLVVVVTLAAVLACRSAGAKTTPAPSSTPAAELPKDVPKELIIIWETYRYLQQDFVDKAKLDPKALSEAAVRGMLQAVNDPHTSYISPEVFRYEQESLKGSFEGIGAFVSMVNGRIAIISPIAGSPAERAGVRGEDVILEINGEKTDKMSLDEAVLKIRGPRGTTVRILIMHKDASEPTLLEIVRDTVKLASVHTQKLQDGLARIQITTFSEDTTQELIAALKELQNEKVSGIVLDLRNNPGGLLTSTVEVASQFLSSGIVVYEIDGDGNRKDWRVQGRGLARDTPLVVLVNAGSASGSEVLVGALQDHSRAKVIGTTTFGKGSVNFLRPLSNEGGLSITHARWYTPSGRQIEKSGLTPDIEVPVTKEDTEARRDPQLEKAIDLLRQQVASTGKLS